MARTLTRRRDSDKPPTLFDRCAVALSAGLLTFALGSLVLLLPTPIGFGLTSKGAFLILLAISVVFAALGFTLRVNFITDVIARLAHAVVYWW
jgi:uncharacterized YccA/Bax inhibitor family protein